MHLVRKIRYPKIGLGLAVVGLLTLIAFFVENVVFRTINMAAYATLLVAFIWQYFRDPARRGAYVHMMLVLGTMAVVSSFTMPRGIMNSVWVLGWGIVMTWASFSIVISQPSSHENPHQQ
jgi:hypothetical protein